MCQKHTRYVADTERLVVAVEANTMNNDECFSSGALPRSLGAVGKSGTFGSGESEHVTKGDRSTQATMESSPLHQAMDSSIQPDNHRSTTPGAYQI